MTTLVVPRTTVLRMTAAGMLAIEIAIHAYLAPAHLEEVPYIGVLFVASSVLLTLALLAVFFERTERFGWALGAALCLGMAAAFVVSRVFGLPDYHESWTSDSSLGLLSLPPELVFLVCARRGWRLGWRRA
jgi:hypothetical protein